MQGTWLTRSQNGIYSLQDVGINTPPQPNSGWVFKKIHLTFRPLLQCILLLKMEATTGTGLVLQPIELRTSDVWSLISTIAWSMYKISVNTG